MKFAPLEVIEPARSITPMLRVQTFSTTWWFVAIEAGVLNSDEKAPSSRITAGFDL